MATNYFTCTLGQAAQLPDKPPGRETVNSFIDHQSKTVPDLPAVAFPTIRQSVPGQYEPIAVHCYTFEDIRRGSIQVAASLQDHVSRADAGARNIVALLCPSTPTLLFAWLGLMRLGYGVLLIAPQCQPEAIAHLCKTCGAITLLYDRMYEDLIQQTRMVFQNDEGIVFSRSSLDEIVDETLIEEGTFADSIHVEPARIVSAESVAYLHHTSGTSSGLPKPIPQSHRTAVGVLPYLPGSSGHATFSTTPLYHGGIADLFRAWTSNAMIYLFRSKTPGPSGRSINITSNTILASLRAIQGIELSLPPVRYFSSVPYVLQLLGASPEGLEFLKNIDCVGVGGAALPQDAGDRFVNQDVNLLSRFGSAECGFLMSSHRRYDEDKEWQFLRPGEGIEGLVFEPRDDGKSELVVSKEWPQLAKTNRPDGSYATADLFAQHPHVKGAWKYDSRADSQLTLITGKKFDPAPIESKVCSSPLLDDIYIFGNGRAFPGALLFRSERAAHLSDADLIASLSGDIEDLNARSQDHARLPRNMLVPIVFGENRLVKSSKGTILRNKAEESYAQDIEDAYQRLESSVTAHVPDSDVVATVRDIITHVSGHRLGVDDDMFSHGVDSVGSIQIRYMLRKLVPSDSTVLPLSIVEDCGTVGRLADFVIDFRHGQRREEAPDQLKVMRGLVEQFGNFGTGTPGVKTQSNGAINESGGVIVLTGATGALGAHLLNLFRNDRQVSKIYCLVRGADKRAALERVSKSLFSRRLKALSNCNSKVVVLPCRLSDSRLGLNDEDYDILSKSASCIVHAAWAVNFRLQLRSFVHDHIAGTRHLLDLAMSARNRQPPIFAFCSSVASVSLCSQSSIPELISDDPEDASSLGYSQSKWVTEQICARAAAHNQRMSGRVLILRVGQLSGDTVNGIWNSQEAWPLMLGSIMATGALPKLKDQPLDWLPVDIAAKAVIEVLGSVEKQTPTAEQDGEQPGARVFHVLNAKRVTSWTDLLNWMKDMEDFQAIEPARWVASLDKLREADSSHPALKLLDMWRKRYVNHEGTGHGSGDVQEDGAYENAEHAVFETRAAERVAPSLKAVPAVEEEYFRRLWGWIKDNVAR